MQEEVERRGGREREGGLQRTSFQLPHVLAHVPKTTMQPIPFSQ